MVYIINFQNSCGVTVKVYFYRIGTRSPSTSHLHSLPGAHPGISQGGPIFFPCIVARRVRKINFTSSYLPCCRLPQSSHIAKSIKNRLQRCKSRNLNGRNPKNIVFFRSPGEGGGGRALPLGAPLLTPLPGSRTSNNRSPPLNRRHVRLNSGRELCAISRTSSFRAILSHYCNRKYHLA